VILTDFGACKRLIHLPRAEVVSTTSLARADEIPPQRCDYAKLRDKLLTIVPAHRLIDDPLRRLAYGTDASFYRLVPELVAIVEAEAEVIAIINACRAAGAPITFRAAGTSLSGQAVSDSVLVLLGDGWDGSRVAPDASTIALQPGVVGAEANRRLAPYGRKIGPDPASIATAKIGGIAANNASGMCCGTAQNSYRTLEAMRAVLADGAALDTADQAGVAEFRTSHRDVLDGLAVIARDVKADGVLAERIRHKFRLKNTTGYALNALVDFEDPIEILTHLMIGSEGTLGFISEITYRTVPEYADKASALAIFPDLGSACRTVTLLKSAPVDAVELLDRASLESVKTKPGMPVDVDSLGAQAAALLIETRAPNRVRLDEQIALVEDVLALSALAGARFSRDPVICGQFWDIRKGTFPAVGAVRPAGTTVVIEDVAFPIERLAQATEDLQDLLAEHGYPEAIIFGHALEGNLHFVFAQGFDDACEVERYRRMMDALACLVVEKYDGSLKAEHGTGRNMAPFVEKEWGRDAYRIMRRVKQLLDPNGILNPGVILNNDPEIHLRNLKPLPVAEPLIDRCTECGFCEPKCPSHGLTLSPRQRITSFREITRLSRTAPESAVLASMRADYTYAGDETCAGCGLCSTLCPIGIDTGAFIRKLRNESSGRADRMRGRATSKQFALVQEGTRLVFRTADVAHAILGTGAMSALANGLGVFGRKVPKWVAEMPRAAPAVRGQRATAANGDAIVYVPSCVTRIMGPQRGDHGDDVPTVAKRVFERAGYAVVIPDRIESLCCGQRFASAGLAAVADMKAAEMLREIGASADERIPIVLDTSPCTFRLKSFAKAPTRVLDIVEFLADRVLPRLELAPVPGPIALHAVCSVRRMGLETKLLGVAQACAKEVVSPPDVSCCGFAGDKGSTHPELNAHALRTLKSALPDTCTTGYSSSRTCEIGLSHHSGRTYRSILHLVDEAST
jgi:D-lactate dehydrogenase